MVQAKLYQRLVQATLRWERFTRFSILSFWDCKVVKMLDLKSELFMRLLWMFRPTFLGHYWMPSRKLVSKHRRPSRLAYLPCTRADLAYSQFGGSEIVLTIHCFEIFLSLLQHEGAGVAYFRSRLGRHWHCQDPCHRIHRHIHRHKQKYHCFHLVSLFLWPALLGDLWALAFCFVEFSGL